MKKINFQQLLLEKGERIGLCVAGGLAVILLALTLFMPGKGLFSGSASAHIEELTKLNTNLKSKHQAARPVDNDKPPDLKDALVKFDHRLFDASEFPNHPGFFTPPPTDTKRHKPTLLLCDEFQVAVLVGSFPALQVKFDDVGGKRVITHIEVVESTASEGGSTPGYTPGTLQTDQFKKGPGGSMGFKPPGGGSGPGAGRPGTTNPYQG
ncbi:MAG TPA: hypothetical protein VKD72_15540, partial [Gemmataceae bacterium]|nr:hypothetical protein [Gemmataceae bacterium]